MSKKVLTQDSTVKCDHQGSVSLAAGQSKFKIGGKNVLIQGDMPGKGVSGCTTVTDGNTSTLQCASVLSGVGGVSSKITVNGVGVLIEGHGGQTNGTVGGTPQSWSVQNPNQSKVTVSG